MVQEEKNDPPERKRRLTGRVGCEPAVVELHVDAVKTGLSGLSRRHPVTSQHAAGFSEGLV